jgi:hypothetical protein
MAMNLIEKILAAHSEYDTVRQGDIVAASAVAGFITTPDRIPDQPPCLSNR